MPKISALPTTTTVAGTDVFPVVQSSTTKQAAISTIAGALVTSGTGVVKATAGVLSATASAVVDADVSASAAIAVTKLATGAANTVLCGGTNNSFRTIVNADVDAAAAIAGTKVAPNFGSQNVSTTGSVTGGSFVTSAGFISIGSGSIASVGNIRFSSAAQNFVTMRSTSDTDDVTILATDASNNLYIGTNTGFTSTKQASNISMYATSGGTLALGLGGTTYMYFLAATGATEAWKPITGSAIGNTPYALNGIGTQAMADANQTAAAAVYKFAAIRTTGALTANRTLTLPAAGDSDAYEKTIVNACTGAFNVVVSSGAGTTVSVGNGKTAKVLIDSTGVRRLTADV